MGKAFHVITTSKKAYLAKGEKRIRLAKGNYLLIIALDYSIEDINRDAVLDENTLLLDKMVRIGNKKLLAIRPWDPSRDPQKRRLRVLRVENDPQKAVIMSWTTVAEQYPALAEEIEQWIEERKNKNEESPKSDINVNT